MIHKIIGPQGLMCPHPWAIYIHVYLHNIQTSSLLKPLGQSNSPAQNQFDLELWYKVFFFFTDSCRLDIAIKDSG